MNTQNAGNLVIFGMFLMLLGIIGYMTHPERAYAAIALGGCFGVLFVLWGILGFKGARWSKAAAILTAAVLGAACVWRGSVGWIEVAQGQSEMAFTSGITTVMLAVAIVALVLVIKSPAGDGAEASVK